MNYFQLFNLEERYDIDLALLNENYLFLQNSLHVNNLHEAINPSNFPNTSELNKAFTILRSDLKRAEYLLSLRGVNIESLETEYKLPKEVLAQIWEELEQADELKDLTELKDLLDEKLVFKGNLLCNLTSAFKENEINKAVGIVVRLRYLANLIEKIKLNIKNANHHN